MDDARFGTEDARGNWKPHRPVGYAPIFVWPWKLMPFLKWMFGFPGYFLPGTCFMPGLHC
jgi:hypothetical protein